MTAPSGPSRPSGPSSQPRERLRPASLFTHVLLLVLLAAALAGGLAIGAWQLLGRPDATGPLPAPVPVGAVPSVAVPASPSAGARPRALTAAERLDSLKLVLAVVAGLGGIVALTVAYRKQRLGEAAAGRERTRAYTDRMVKAVEQLGHDQPRVRVAGLYALAHLADDWADGRQMCIDVLCAYARMPYDPDGPEAAAGEREVRRTLFRIVRNHLRPDPWWGTEKWSTNRFSFEGATIDEADLSRAVLTAPGHMTFHGARFTNYLALNRFRLERRPGPGRDGGPDTAALWFTGSRFEGRHIDFGTADFTGGTVDFTGASGGVRVSAPMVYEPENVVFGDDCVVGADRLTWPAPAGPRRWWRAGRRATGG